MPATAAELADRTTAVTVTVPARCVRLFQYEAREALSTYADGLRDSIDGQRKREQGAHRDLIEGPADPGESYADYRDRMVAAWSVLERACEWSGGDLEVTGPRFLLREIAVYCTVDLTEQHVHGVASHLDPNDVRDALDELAPYVELRELIEAA